MNDVNFLDTCGGETVEPKMNLTLERSLYDSYACKARAEEL